MVDEKLFTMGSEIATGQNFPAGQAAHAEVPGAEL